MAVTFRKNDFKGYPKRLSARLKTAVYKTSVLAVSHIRQTYFGNHTGSNKLHYGGGELPRSIKPKPVELKGFKVHGGIMAGTVYSSVHIGRKGKTTTIRPRKAKMLAIPLAAAKTKSGMQRRLSTVIEDGKRKITGPWGKTFVAKSKRGNLIVFGQRMTMKGKNAGKIRGNIIPLFVLKKQVRIRTRIHPKDIMKWIRPRLDAEIKKITEKV